MTVTNRRLSSSLLALASVCSLGVAGCAAKYNNAAGIAAQPAVILWNTTGPAQVTDPLLPPTTANPNPVPVQPAPVAVIGTMYSATPLGPNELNATSSTPGTFVYTPAAGTFLTPGTQTLSVTLTPNDTTNYKVTTRTVQIQVNDITAATSQPALAPQAVQIVAGGYVDGVFFHPLQKDLRYARTDVGGAYRWVEIPYQISYTDSTGNNVPNSCPATPPVGGSLEPLQTGNWVPLLDFVGAPNLEDMGVESLGLDPSDPKRLYLSTGLNYGNYTGDQNHFMLSDDQGATFTQVNAPFPINGNDNGRDAGERFGVDPNLGTTIYYGSRTAGLWKSLDRGLTWNQVTSFPVTGPTQGAGVVFVSFVPASGTPGTATPVIYAGVSDYNYYANDGSNAGTPTYSPIYRSVDAGASWQAVPGQPTSVVNPSGGTTPTNLNLTPIHGMVGADGVSYSNGSLYVTYFSDQGPGDNNAGGGAVYQYTPTPGAPAGPGTWTDISPNSVRTSSDDGGYSGLALDAELPGVIMVGTQDDYNRGDTIYRSLDYGRTWVDLKHVVGMVNDAGPSQWLYFNKGTAGTGNWPSSIAIDPFDSNHVIYGTGQTLWDTTNVEQADLGQTKPPIFEPGAYGAAKGGRLDTAVCDPAPPKGPGVIGGASIEETVVLALASPPVGAPLLSAVGDLGTFVHNDLNTSPPFASFGPQFTTGTSIDFAQSAPLTVVRVGSGSDTTAQSPYTPTATAPAGTVCDSSNPKEVDCVQITVPVLFAFTTDGGVAANGQDWMGVPTLSSAPNLKSVTVTSTISQKGGGTVAIAPDASSTVWAPSDLAPQCTGQLNTSPNWTPATGGILGAQVVADRVTPGVYYMYDGKSGSLLKGTATVSSGTAAVPFQCTLAFAPQASLPAGSYGQLTASFGVAGEFFLAISGANTASVNGLYHSTDFGKTLTQVPGFTKGYAVGFGAPATDASIAAYSKPAIYTAAIGASGYGFYRSIDDGATWLLVSNTQHLLGQINVIIGDQRQFGRYYIGTGGRGIGYSDTQ